MSNRPAVASVTVEPYRGQYQVTLVYADDSLEDDTRFDCPDAAREHAHRLADRHHVDVVLP